MSRRIRIDPFKEHIVDEIVKSLEETAPLIPKPSKDESIDDCLKYALYQLQLLVRSLARKVQEGATDRETVQGLKDVITLLMDLRKHEKDLLENLPDDELKKLAEND